MTTVDLDDLLDREAVAGRLGVQAASITRYRQRDESFPVPVRVFGNDHTPVWLAADVDRWIAARPGRGAGGGRPRKPEPEPVAPAKRVRARRAKLEPPIVKRAPRRSRSKVSA